METKHCAQMWRNKKEIKEHKQLFMVLDLNEFAMPNLNF